MRSRLLQTFWVVAATLFAIGAPIAQAQGGWGQSAAEFAADGDDTLRAAGYAFSIWSLLYAGMAVFAVYQALPRNQASDVVRSTAGPAGAAFGLCGAWILFSAWDLEWLTVATILLAAGLATRSARASTRIADARRRDIWFCGWPTAALAGWLTVAAAINILTALTAHGLLGEAGAGPAGLGGLAAVVVAAGLALRWTRLWIYALPVAWGLVAVFVAERADKPVVAWTALAAAGAVLAMAWVWRSSAGRR